MASESMSTQHVNLAERYSSFADYAASTAALPQTAATSLDIARFHAFTGELTFSVDPAVRLYLDGGNVYHAERDGDRPVSHVLLDAGVIDSTQLQRGIVSVGAVEHLGRLFDRDTTIDRDAVMVVIESATEALLQQIANSVVAPVSATAYRHHPSGIHRWFVAPAEPTGTQRPASGVMQVDRSVVEEFPRLSGGASGPADGADPAAPPLRIHWDEPDATIAEPDADIDAELAGAAGDMNIDIEAELDRFDADRADWTASSAATAADGSDAVVSPLGEFHIVWPDGTQDTPLVEPTPSVESTSPVESFVEDATTLSPEPTIAEPIVPTLEPAPAPSTQALDAPVATPATPFVASAPEAADSDPMSFSMKPLQIDRIPEPDSAVPDDVAAAVRRALQAIEGAAATPTSTSVPELPLTPVALPEFPVPGRSTTTPSTRIVEQAAAPAAPEAARPLGFAPPTMDMRAEAVYERAAAQAAAPIVAEGPVAQPAPVEAEAAVPATEDDQHAAKDRRSALQRLIGSLRIKD